MLSKNREARERENMIFKKLTGGATEKSAPFFRSMKEWWGNIKGIKPFKSNKTYGLKACIYKFPRVYGLFDVNGMKFYITSGMFYWGIPLRFLAPAELPIIEVN